jgi:small-conductance mechanosensitive channel
MKTMRLLIAIALSLAALLGAGIAAAEDWTGTWDSRWRSGGARLVLQQQGERVTGTYTPYDGRIEARADGLSLRGEWIEGERRGAFEFARSRDGASFAGRFDSGEWWTGRRVPPGAREFVIETDKATPRETLRGFLRLMNIHRGRVHDAYERLLPLVAFAPEDEGATVDERIAALVAAYDVIDQFRLRLWEVPGAVEGDRAIHRLARADEKAGEIAFRRAGDGWRIALPSLQRSAAALAALVAAAPARPRGPHASPRATMRAFLSAMADGTLEGRRRAALALDLSQVPAAVRASEGPLLAEFLKGVLDRAGLVVLQELPDDPGADESYIHYFHPAGRVAIAPVDRDDARAWLFSASTVASLRGLYAAVEPLPETPGVLEQDAHSLFFRVRSWAASIDHRLLQAPLLLETWQWIGILLVLAGGYLGGMVLAALVFAVVGPRIARLAEERNWALERRVKIPVRLCFAAALWFAAIGVMGLSDTAQHAGQTVAVTLLSIGVVWAGYSLVDLLAAAFLGRAQRAGMQFDAILVSLVVTVAKAALAAGGVILVADILDLPWSGVLAGLGVGGLAVAFAARSTVENFFGAAMLLSDRPFKTGDSVVAGGISGSIEHVGLRSTRIRTADDSVVYVPNATLASATIDNRGRRRHWMFRTVFGLTFDTPPEKLDAFVAGVKEVVRAHPAGRDGRLFCAVVNFGESAIEVELISYLQVKSLAEDREAKHAILLEVIRLAARLDVSFAFPTRTVVMGGAGAAALAGPGSGTA